MFELNVISMDFESKDLKKRVRFPNYLTVVILEVMANIKEGNANYSLMTKCVI